MSTGHSPFRFAPSSQKNTSIALLCKHFLKKTKNKIISTKPASLQLQRQEVLMVGDTLHTDILGGNKFGIDTLLVLSGNTSESEYQTKIKATGVIPDYVSRSIVT